MYYGARAKEPKFVYCSTCQDMFRKAEKYGAGNSEMKMMTSLYYLGSNDDPGSLITQVQLRDGKCKEWAGAVRTLLQARRKFGFTCETIKRPTDDLPKIENWWTI